jgi:hypothetical protein
MNSEHFIFFVTYEMGPIEQHILDTNARKQLS